MQIALDDIAGYVAPEKVVLCEGGTLPGKTDFDANCATKSSDMSFRKFSSLAQVVQKILERSETCRSTDSRSRS